MRCMCGRRVRLHFRLLMRVFCLARIPKLQTMIEFFKEHVPDALVDKIVEDGEEPSDTAQVEAETKAEL